MRFPWARYWQRVGIIFAIVLVMSLLGTAGFNGGRISLETALVALADSIMLALVLAFPLTQRVYRGPRRH